MATQQGLVSLSGKVGDMVFSVRKGKKHVKAASTKPMNQTEATKKSSSDFGEASKIGARMRRAFAPLITNYGDITTVSRFTKHTLKIFKTISPQLLGQKKFKDGDIKLFRDFQFNASVRLDSLLHQQPRVKLEASGLKIVFKQNPIGTLFKWAAKANAAVLQLMVYTLNLDDANDEVISVKDLVIALEDEHFQGAQLNIPLNLIGEQVVSVAMGMHFLAGKQIIGDKTKRAASIMYITRLSDGIEVPFVYDQPLPIEKNKDEGTITWELL